MYHDISTEKLISSVTSYNTNQCTSYTVHTSLFSNDKKFILYCDQLILFFVMHKILVTKFIKIFSILRNVCLLF